MSVALSNQFTKDLRPKRVKANDLAPTQVYVDPVKVSSMAKTPTGKPIVTGAGGTVQDGHHRWVAGSKRGRKTVDAYILG